VLKLAADAIHYFLGLAVSVRDYQRKVGPTINDADQDLHLADRGFSVAARRRIGEVLPGIKVYE
jgi:hypothetical protein